MEVLSFHVCALLRLVALHISHTCLLEAYSQPYFSIVHYLPKATRTKYHSLSGLKTEEIYFLRVWTKCMSSEYHGAALSPKVLG